jgi:hypothetical protein
LHNVRPQYIPDIPMNFNKNLNDVDIIKPKNRFKNWKPVMRNLQSTYEVRDNQFPREKYIVKDGFRKPYSQY